MTPETKVPDRTKGGREGKNAVVGEPIPNKNDWGRTVCGKKAAHEHDKHVIV